MVMVCGGAGAAGRRRGRLAEQRGLPGGLDDFEFLHPGDGDLRVDAREDRGDFADLLPARQLAPGQPVDAHRLERLRHAKLRPDLRPPNPGITGASSTAAMRTTSAAV